MKLSKYTIVRKNSKYTILGNTNNGKWIRISNELYNIFDKLFSKDGLEGVIENSTTRKLAKLLLDIEVIIENETEEDTIKVITFAITNQCNLECIHCGFSANIREVNELDTETIISTISQFKNIEHIEITGGEPLLHKGFQEIAEYIGKNVRGTKTLMTNAVLISEDNVELLINNFDNIAISIDAASEEVCNEMRGHNVYNKVISAINLLKSKNFNNISLSFVETEVNKKELEEFRELCKRLEVEPVIRKLFSTGRAMDNKNRLISNNKYDDKKMKEKISIVEYRKNLKLATRCVAAVSSIYIQFNGDIYPCPVAGIEKNFRMGNIREIIDWNTFLSGRYEQTGFKNYADLAYNKLGNCSGCEVRDFCWRCLQEYYSIFPRGQMDSEECAIRKRILMEIVWGD